MDARDGVLHALATAVSSTTMALDTFRDMVQGLVSVVRGQASLDVLAASLGAIQACR